MSSAIACWVALARRHRPIVKRFAGSSVLFIQNFAMKVTGLDDGRMAVTNVLQNEDTVSC